MLANRLDDLLRGDINAQVHNLEARAFQHHGHDVLADIVQVAFYGAAHDGAGGGHGLVTHQQRPQNVTGGACRARCNQHFGNEEFAFPHAASHLIHGGNNRLGKKFARANSFLQHLVRQLFGYRSFSINDCLLKFFELCHTSLPFTLGVGALWKCHLLHKGILKTLIGV